MPSDQWVPNLLSRIAPELQKLRSDYCLIGSGAMLLSGIGVPVHDIDLLTSESGADILNQQWAYNKNSRYKPENPEKFRSSFSRYNLDGHPVEVMGDLEVLTPEGWKAVKVESVVHTQLEGCSIRLPSLGEQKRILHLLGREKDIAKIKMIEEFENK